MARIAASVYTVGMGHPLQGACPIDKGWDNRFPDRLVADPVGRAAVPRIESMREAARP